MKKLSVTFILLFTLCGTYSQTKMTLQDCIDFAIEHNNNLNANELELQKAELSYKNEKQKFLPILSAEINNGFSNGFQQVFSETSAGQYETISSYGNNAAFDISVPIWNANVQRVLIKKQEYLCKSLTANNKNEELKIKMDVIEKFYAVAIAHTQYEIAKNNVETQDSTLQFTIQLENLGIRSEKDVLNAKTNLSQDRCDLIKAEKSLLAAKIALQYSICCNDSIDIETSTDTMIYNLPIYQTVIEQICNIHPLINKNRYDTQIAEYDLKHYSRMKLPSINFNYESGTSAQFFMNQSNTKLLQQWGHNSYQTAFINIKIPIFNQLSYKRQVEQTKIEIQQKQKYLDVTLTELEEEIKRLYIDYEQNLLLYNQLEQTELLSYNQYKYAQSDYKQGNTTNYELNVYKDKYIETKMQKTQLKFELLYKLSILKTLIE